VLESTSIPAGLVPAKNGEPAIGVNVPVVVSNAYPETLFDPLLATHTNLSEGQTRFAVGFAPAAKGEVGNGVKAPVSADAESGKNKMAEASGGRTHR
jgi:hypothetical protein